MSGYLEGYGEQSRRKEKVTKWLILSLVLGSILACILYFQFRDYAEERVVSSFFEKLASKDFKGAYATWGCSDAQPCPQYPFDEFLEDWGPAGVYGRGHSVVGMKSCATGIIKIVRVPKEPDVLLWVDRSTDTVSFAPWKLKSIPEGTKYRFQAWMWDVTRNCTPLVGP